MSGHKPAAYNLIKSVKVARKRYRNKVKLQFQHNNSRHTWDLELADEFNVFFVRFKVSAVAANL